MPPWMIWIFAQGEMKSIPSLRFGEVARDSKSLWQYSIRNSWTRQVSNSTQTRKASGLWSNPGYRISTLQYASGVYCVGRDSRIGRKVRRPN